MNNPATLSFDTPAAPVAPLKPGPIVKVLAAICIAIVVGILAWQGITSGGNPNPEAANRDTTAAILDIAVLVFREGLETILVLTAIMASMVGANAANRKPIMAGAGVGFLLSIVTWFVAVGIMSDLTQSVNALDLQAATGLLAIVVLLIVMNWFFHKVYWGGWITMHNRKKKELLNEGASQNRLLLGLAILGMASVYREGFEIVLFLQSYNLKLGGKVVLIGALIGLFFTGIVAFLNFIAHRRLPYRKMLIFTGIMLGVVLLVMVGEEVQEMQLAHWLPTTTIPFLEKIIPDWAGLWFAIFPTVESLAAQVLAALLVGGSYFLARGSSSSETPAKA